MSRLLGISHPIIWTLLHKLRRAMIRPAREPLSGVVEVDETCIGGFAAGKPGRSLGTKALVVTAVEVKGITIGRNRMRVINSASSENLLGFIQDFVEPDRTVVITDGWSGFSRLKLIGYTHALAAVALGQETLPRVHLAISLLKRLLMGTFHGAVEQQQSPYYLDEFCFRFNRRRSS